jgi:microcystin-dependent protein
LVGTNPTTADPLSEGDNHLRLIKDVLKRTFPSVTGAVTVSNNQINNGIADTSTATNVATPSTLVKRDASGNFSATVITSNFIGNLIGDMQGDIYASNGINRILNNGTDGTEAIFTGTATKASAIEVDGVSADVEHRMVFGEDNDGINAPEYLYKDSAANFTYNPSTNALTAGSFVGAVALSNVTGLQSALDAKTTLLAVWPIGSIYTSVTSANPSTLFGGNWEAFGAGRVLIGLDSADTDFDAAEETGGAKTHTLTTAEMPSHTHTFTAFQTISGSNNRTGGGALSASASSTTASTGGGGAHNNVQPYIVVYMFKRIAD